MSTNIDAASAQSALRSTSVQAASGQDSGSVAAGIQAQIDQLEHQLSDCVNCASAKSPEGKAQIDDISSKLANARQRLDHLSTHRPDSTPATSSAPGPDNGTNAVSSSSHPSVAATTEAQPVRDRLSNVGTIVDTQG